MKNLYCMIIMLAVTCIVPQLTLAAPEGNPRKGKYLYRKNCLSCHQHGSENQLGPDSKSQKEWETTFAKETLPMIHCAKEWGALSEKDILDIFTHLHSHASDSPAPAACR